MRFAIQDETKIEATPKAVGKCPGCGADLVARCGTRKVWHWAHKGRRHCDHWWENETEWHRKWKDHFPTDWQEIGSRDADGELHIADVRTPAGLVVEFQHSYLKSAEAKKRTEFHSPIIWVVDATRRPTDIEQFTRSLRDAQKHNVDGGTVYQIYWAEEVRLFREWAGLNVIIAFDLGMDDVWLLRRIQHGTIYGFFYPKADLVKNILGGAVPPDVLFGKPRQTRTNRGMRRAYRGRY
ncbi:hypothetical protein L0664_06840 [Octadecabacter sp. G9-8]|uniref:Competence protein CoiA-like N-terminal domain-containing protein n=1 Tax=Octadecabacter dasysiphoniae TaxID=2909341 RepID=A0ABS9CUD5_9RHOB|nr:competence protein CoiA family protein [Octadecabacter dasysiphoniae]MCF2870778.1 hypothetical protein [Octadecabacter dasysiphoniae]